MSLLKRFFLAIGFVLFLSGVVLAQPEMRSGSKGSSSAKPVTASSVDANVNSID